MARPAVTDAAEELHDALGPWARADGEDTDWALLHLSEAVAAPLDEVNELARDTDAGPGWSAVVDADRAPAGWLPWLARFVGVTVPPGLSEAGRRTLIGEASGFKRGTLEAVRGAARTLLTGSGVVTINERDTSAYHFTVITYLGQTPDEDAVHTALEAATPGGLQMTYIVQPGITIDQLDGTIDAQAGTIDEYAMEVP